MIRLNLKDVFLITESICDVAKSNLNERNPYRCHLENHSSWHQNSHLKKFKILLSINIKIASNNFLKKSTIKL